MEKTEVARRQLGAGLWLLLNRKCLASAMTLTCAGAEIAEALAQKSTGTPFSSIALAENPDTPRNEWYAGRQIFANALKHAQTRNGTWRCDNAILRHLDQESVTLRLIVGWLDFSTLGKPYPLEAHVLIVWGFALYGNCSDSWTDGYFPYLYAAHSYSHKLEILKRTIERFSQDSELVGDPRVERAPLLQGR